MVIAMMKTTILQNIKLVKFSMHEYWHTSKSKR